MIDPITPSQFHAAEGLGDWRVLSEGACAFFRTGSFTESVRLVQAIGQIDGVDDHPPAIDIRHDGVTARLVSISDDFMGMTQRDADIARRISGAARELGVAADPTAVQNVMIIPGAPDIRAVMPFWRAVLGYEPRPDSPDEDLVDPHDRGPAFWFESMEAPRPDGGGAIHLAIWVAPEEAEARVAAALAAGGRLVRDDYAPTWWTLSDSAGNEADISTIQGRD